MSEEQNSAGCQIKKIISMLKEAGAGVKVKELCRRHGIVDVTYYTCKSTYVGMSASDLKRMRDIIGRKLSGHRISGR